MENLDQILDAPVAEERKLKTAGFWIRVVASIIDGILLYVAQIVIAFSIGRAVPVLGTVVSLILSVCYYAFMESSENQATLGKMAVGIKVGDYNGEQISFINAIGRHFAKYLSCLILFIGFMMAGWDEKNQALHDKLANTYVFYK